MNGKRNKKNIYGTDSEKTSRSVFEALMRIEDENIIDITLAVPYPIKNAKDYLFNVENQEVLLKTGNTELRKSNYRKE
ncbi:MAG: hypothetical protein PHY16_10480 [Methylobacter sp.]|nr:hypothetical protein [Methylobacter sp.]